MNHLLFISFPYELVEVIGRTFIATSAGTCTSRAMSTILLLPYQLVDYICAICCDKKTYYDISDH